MLADRRAPSTTKMGSTGLLSLGSTADAEGHRSGGGAPLDNRGWRHVQVRGLLRLLGLKRMAGAERLGHSIGERSRAHNVRHATTLTRGAHVSAPAGKPRPGQQGIRAARLQVDRCAGGQLAQQALLCACLLPKMLRKGTMLVGVFCKQQLVQDCKLPAARSATKGKTLPRAHCRDTASLPSTVRSHGCRQKTHLAC